MSLVDLSRYEVRLPFDKNLFDAAQIAVKNFNATPEINFTRITPKKTRELELKKYLVEPVKILLSGDEMIIKFAVLITSEGSLKPSEVLKVLREQFDFPFRRADKSDGSALQRQKSFRRLTCGKRS